jgi:uncharacterized membrane protein YfcA
VAFDGLTALAGVLVGAIVGITGVGGGALMTPILVMLFGIAPHTAIGTDLVYASITKMAGFLVHHQHGSVDWQVVRRLAYGSLPAAALTLLWMTASAAGQRRSGAVMTALAVALLVTALGMLLKDWLHGLGRAFRVAEPSRFKHLQPLLTIGAGVLLGVLVTWTSIGAGALGTVLLVYLYPLRMTASRLVGTDLAHAIPLALVAGLGHLAMGNVDAQLLANLLVGSIPGVVAGAFISTRAPLNVIRYAIALALTAVAIRMLVD